MAKAWSLLINEVWKGRSGHTRHSLFGRIAQSHLRSFPFFAFTLQCRLSPKEGVRLFHFRQSRDYSVSLMALVLPQLSPLINSSTKKVPLDACFPVFWKAICFWVSNSAVKFLYLLFGSAAPSNFVWINDEPARVLKQEHATFRFQFVQNLSFSPENHLSVFLARGHNRISAL